MPPGLFSTGSSQLSEAAVGGARVVAMHQNLTENQSHRDAQVTLYWRREHLIRIPS